MKKYQKLLLGGIYLILLPWITFTPVNAQGEIYIDHDCQPVSETTLRQLPTNEKPWWHYQEIFYGRRFSSNGNMHWLYVARYSDGAAQFCLSSPNFEQPVLLQSESISAQYVETINQQANDSPIFQVRIREGQNDGSPFSDYRLDLSNPHNPSVRLIEKGCCIVWDD